MKKIHHFCGCYWLQEKEHVLGELKLKAKMTTETLNTIEGVTCNEVMGAMYAFPRIHLPEKAIAAAKVNVIYLLILVPFHSVCVSLFPSKVGRAVSVDANHKPIVFSFICSPALHALNIT